MTKNLFGKSRPKENPYATYKRMQIVTGKQNTLH